MNTEELRRAFRRNPDGSWTCVQAIRIEHPVGRIEVTPQISIEPSVSFNWIELPNALVPGRYDQHVAVTRVTYTLTPRAYVSGLVQYNSRSQVVSGNFRFRRKECRGRESNPHAPRGEGF